MTDLSGDEVDGLALATEQPCPVLGRLDLQRHLGVADVLLGGLAETQVGICLCDADDNIRYANAVFRSTYLQCLSEEPTRFVDALATEIRTGRGINLGTMSIEEFVPRARERRKTLSAPHRFASDFNDGRWWQINEHKLDDGWILVLATEISGLKSVEAELRKDHATALKAAQTDVLTGLSNRRFGLEQAQSAIADFNANRLPLTVALIDISITSSGSTTFMAMTSEIRSSSTLPVRLLKASAQRIRSVGSAGRSSCS